VTEDEIGVRMLETQLDLASRWGRRSLEELHRVMLADLVDAQKRARRAERRLAKLRRRVRRAETELVRLRASRAHRVASMATTIRPRLRRIARRAARRRADA
jgi:hypothetical protein